MRKALKLLGFLSVTAVLFFIVSTLAFYYLMRVGEFRRFLIEEIEKNADLKVQLGAADLEIGWITGIVFRDLALSEPDAPQPAITAAQITARVALLPLLHRQVVFYEIRLQQPAAQFVRNKEGHIPLLDKLLNLPFLKQADSEFSLDLRSIKLQNADIDYSDQRSEGSLGTWRLVNATIDLERVRGQRLRDFMQQQVLKREPSDYGGAALEFDLRSVVVKDNAKMNLKAQGRLLFPKETLEFHEARWIADLQLVDFPASLIKDHLGARLPIKSMTGHLGQRVHVEGNPGKQIRVKSDLEFKQLAIDAPELFLVPLNGADGRMTFEVDWSQNRLRVLRADFRANDIKFSLQGDVDGMGGKDPHFRLNLSALSAPVSVLRKYLPLKIINSSEVENRVNSMQAGQVEIKKAGVNATLSQLRRLAQSEIGPQIWFDAEVRDIAGTLSAKGAFPLRGVEGQISLAKGIVTFRNVRGFYGDSRFTDIDGSYVLSPTEKGKLDLQLRGDVDLAELKEQVRAGLFSARAAKIASSLQDLAGRSKIDFALKRSADAPLQFDGKIALENVRVRYDDHSFSDLQGEVNFTPNEIKTDKLRAQVSGSPIQLQLAIKDYDSDDGTFDLGIESPGVSAGVVTSLLLDTGTLKDPGIVRGAVRYSGSFNTKIRRNFVGNLDLLNVQVMVHPLLQPLRELNGKVKIDEAGIDFQNINASLVGFPASASGRWRYGEKTQLHFDFSAPNLDITYLISQIDPESSDFYATLVAEGKIALNKGRIKNFEFAELKTNATIDHRVWRLTNLTGRSAGGAIQGVTTIFDRPDTLGVLTEPKIQGVPIQSFLNWFNITNTEMTGKVNLTGKLETVGRNDPERKQNLNGAFNLRIEDGTINRMRIVVQILNLLDLSRWFTLQLPDLAKQGIRFRSITGDFKVNKGVYSTENLIVDSSDLRMTGAGKIDVPKDEVDFIVAVRPFAGIDSAMSYIPLLGRSIAAIKNSFLVASFNVTGRIDDPTITPAPLGTLTEWFWGVLGIPKNIIGLGDTEKPEEPKEPAKPSPK
jgi:uncharacterized protein YhdP